MTDAPPPQPPGWYHAQGDPPGTQRYWDGSQWQGGPQPAPTGAPGAAVGTGTTDGAGAGDLASPGQRLGARIIDWVLWTVVFMVFGLFIVGDGIDDAAGFESTGQAVVAGVLSTIAVVAYETWFVANRGGTPGKLALGLRVAGAETRATPVDYRSAALRAAPLALGIIPVVGGSLRLLVALASFVLIFTDRRRQAVWDKLAGTVVVRAR